jgi:hypothetical protein
MMPGDPMLVVLKIVNSEIMDTLYAANTVHTNNIHKGGNSVVTVGSNNTVNVNYHIKGNLERFKEELARNQIPAADIEELAILVQQEKPDPSGNLPARVMAFINRVANLAKEGAGKVAVDLMVAIFVEVAKRYYF